MAMQMHKWSLAGAVLLLAACSSNNDEPQQQGTSARIDHLPTSAHCANVGGTTTIAHTLNGEAVRMCQMPDGKQCEEWALGQGACASAG
ncbi:Putative hemolysin [Serratia rubidaea]|uniref:Hemolysin n=2 Tax=Serratia rubidaea TaxID=61652 RepID=A0A3S4FWX6_SERRU|nr:putative hemolysin [Serratia sp. FGI94]CAI0816289.1 Putative hemolysin [Serratia rubidaea]CAI1621695.1 Putative hemolysin [Serratia rubidaea]VEA73578.1 Putative hemolysin [Serratia rubidaea]VEI70732.1 Putative hemolysin [Serratia rubidaea]